MCICDIYDRGADTFPPFKVSGSAATARVICYGQTRPQNISDSKWLTFWATLWLYKYLHMTKALAVASRNLIARKKQSICYLILLLQSPNYTIKIWSINTHTLGIWPFSRFFWCQKRTLGIQDVQSWYQRWQHVPRPLPPGEWRIRRQPNLLPHLNPKLSTEERSNQIKSTYLFHTLLVG